MKRLLTALALFAVVAAAAYGTWPQAAINPLTLALPEDFAFTADVEERVDAGSYVYLRVRDAQGTSRWLAALSMSASAERRVHVQAYAKSDHFYSRRTGREFSPLFFASVTTLTQESP